MSNSHPDIYVVGLTGNPLRRGDAPRLPCGDNEGICYDQSHQDLLAFLERHRGTFICWHLDTAGAPVIGDAVITLHSAFKAALEAESFVAVVPVPGERMKQVSAYTGSVIHAINYDKL